MGVFKKLKKYFSSDINPDPTKLSGFVVPYPVKGGAVKINSKVVVPSGYAFVLGHNGKALDAFREGEYFLSPATLTECCKKLKIHKMDKNGKIKKKFKADLYFINLKTYDFEFKAAKTEMGNRAMGIFSAGSEGKVTLSVKEPKDLIASLLNEFAYLRSGEAEKIVRNWISECITEVFRKNNFALSELVSINPMIEEKTKSDVSMMLAKQGLMLESFDFTNFVLPKKYQREYLANKKKMEAANESFVDADTEEESPSNESLEQTSSVNQHISFQKKGSADKTYMPFGNIMILEQIEDSQEKLESQNDEKDNNEQESKVDNNEIGDAISEMVDEKSQEATEENASEQFVDLDIDKIIGQNKNGKRCLKCGAINDKEEIQCTVCGNKF